MITSTNNDEVKKIIKLQKSAKLKKEKSMFIVEGMRMFLEIPKNNIKKIYVTDVFYDDNKNLLEDKYLECEKEIVSANVYKAMSDTKTPQGIMALVKQFDYVLDDIIAKENPLIIVLKNLQDPGNLGTIIRTAEGAGVDGIIISSDTVDIYNSKVVRATMGSIFRVPFIYSNNLIEIINQLNDKEILTYAGELSGEDFYLMNYKKSTAFVIGNEGNGISKELLKVIDTKVKIKMKGEVESLNAATAATVFMYEAMRQRTFSN